MLSPEDIAKIKAEIEKLEKDLRASNKTLSLIHQLSNTRCWPSARMLTL
jgi:hypothetical protein